MIENHRGTGATKRRTGAFQAYPIPNGAQAQASKPHRTNPNGNDCGVRHPVPAHSNGVDC